jgi:hypothetical protein
MNEKIRLTMRKIQQDRARIRGMGRKEKDKFLGMR